MSRKYPQIPTQILQNSENKSIINFDTIYDSTISILIIISILAFLFYLFKKLRKRKSDYHSQEYWESRYSLFSQNMDWYCDFNKIVKDFQLNQIFDNYYSNKKKVKIIELGCGNSSLAFDLYNYGYKNISSIDFSNNVINKMKEKYSMTQINCKYQIFIILVICGDFTRMNEIFKESEFDLVVEKAGLDSIATKETPDVSIILKTVYNQIYKVLKPGGYVLSFSIKNPEFWHKNVFEHITNLKMFKVVQQVVTVFTTEKNPTLMNLYFYALISLKQ